MSLIEAVTAVLGGRCTPADLDDPGFGPRYGLSASDLTVLRGLPTGEVEHLRREILSKRWDLLSVLPATTRALTEHAGGRFRRDYLTGTSRPAGVVGRPGWLVQEAAHLAGWLRERPDVPPALLALAEYELLVLELAEDARAGTAAQAETRAAGPPRPHHRPRLSAAVRVRTFPYDVIALAAAPAAEATARQTGVLLQKRWPQRLPVASRSGVEVVRLLARCDGRATIEQLAASADDRVRAAAVLASLVTRNVLTTGEDS